MECRLPSSPSSWLKGLITQSLSLGKWCLRSLAIGVLVVGCGGGSEAPDTASGPEAGASGGASAPSDPGAASQGISAKTLAVVILSGNALSEAIGQAYAKAHGVPAENIVRIELPHDADLVSQADFERARAALDRQLPRSVQATVLAFSKPSRVVGNCAVSITSAMAMGYRASLCGGCSKTEASPYFDSASQRPNEDFGLRPSMMLWSQDLEGALALIERGRASRETATQGQGWLLRTPDAARSVRWPDMLAAQKAWSAWPGLTLNLLDLRATPDQAWIEAQQQVVFYFTGRVTVPKLDTNQFLPGAVADHLTSFAGLLPDANGQMPATAWLKAGATGSYGTVEEPCNYTEKFPSPQVLMKHYLRGETLIEAYWKSVKWPGQGLFLGDPLASPWLQAQRRGS
ncbi:MAG: TIGR03790 family protein [Ideonella sp. MAG2]|nr:MAG: TIGR03790 family protein [Ideonella sp. MAG2]